MRFRFFPRANNRLDEIWQYTVEHCDEEQAERYVRGLFSAIEEIVDRRFLWKPVREVGFPGVFFFRFERHYIFFRELSDGDLSVITILSDRMDLPRRLREEI